MDKFRKLGVFLNQEPGDEEALGFTGKIAEIMDAESVLCIHVRGVEAVPSGAVAPTEEAVAQMIRERLPAKIAERTTVEMHADGGISDILRSARDQSLDLIIVGRRQPHDQLAVGSAFSRLARKAPCSVLVVPDQAYPHVGRIAVPVDGSAHSKLALQTGIDIARNSGEAHPQVVVQSIYEIGYGYQYTGLSFADAVSQREGKAHQQLDQFLADVDTSGVEFSRVVTCSDHPTVAVYDLVATKNLDLIVAGSRGLSSTSALLLGSFTERLIMYSPVPVLVVKRKGETLRFLSALLGQ